MIDEKKLIAYISPGHLRNPNELCFSENDVVEIIKKQPKVGEWIPVSERLPEEKTNPITRDYYEYPVTCNFDGVEDIRYYKFGKGHWYHGFQVMDDYVKAWWPLPEPYKVN